MPVRDERHQPTLVRPGGLPPACRHHPHAASRTLR